MKRFLFALVAALAWQWTTLALAAPPQNNTTEAKTVPVNAPDNAPDKWMIQRPAEPTPIMPLKDVRVGMKGYGLTVFQGDKVEPFPIEVMTVMRDFGPKRAVIWIRCPGERMQKTGPVSGMSGSPIFIWPKGVEQKMGENGLLIGAFAYGYQWTLDSYAGVQPIELMRESGSHAMQKPGDSVADASSPGSVRRMLSSMIAASDRSGRPLSADWRNVPGVTWRTQMMLDLFDTPTDDSDVAPPQRRIPGPLRQDAGPAPQVMPIPVNVGSAALAEAFAGYFNIVGMQPVAGPIGATAGFPPPGVEPDQVVIRPGSVMAIPLAFGDMDLSGTGTVTDVLPDGRVLAFGHAMFGEGEAAVPMASGYVHFVMPRQSNSFKMGGSAVIRGAIVRDENAAVVGVPDVSFPTAPAKVTVDMPAFGKKTFNYQLIMHKRMTPMLAGMVAAQSVTADQGLPVENTVNVKATLKFAGNRTVQIEDVVANASEQAVLMQLAPPVQTMMSNPHISMPLESMEVTIDVEPQARLGAIVDARINRTEAEPGDKLIIDLRLQRYRDTYTSKRITFDLPDSLAEGTYQVMVMDAQNYARQMIQARPHLQQALEADHVYDFVKWVTSMRSDALYVVVQLPDTGLAVGRQELPNLPSSRRALIASPTSTLTTPYFETIEKVVPMDMVVGGRVAFQVEVAKKPGQ